MTMLTLTIISFLFLSVVKNIEATTSSNVINTNMYCGYHADCVIDCRTIKSSISCAGAEILGTDAKSLTVICDSSNGLDSGCRGTSITCPFGKGNPQCNVQCINDNQVVNESGACQDAVILDALDVECNGTNSCKGMTVNCPADGAHKCNVKCNSLKDEYGDSDGACANMKISPISYIKKANWLGLECDQGECDGLQFVCWHYEHSTGKVKTVTDYEYNDDESSYECADDACCPFTTSPSKVPSVLSDSKEENDDNKDETMMIPLVVVSVLFLIICLVSVFLMFLLQKQKMPNNVDARFVQLKEEA